MPVNGQYTDSESDFNTPILKIVDVPKRFWPDATSVALRFLRDHKDRKLGIYHGVAYGAGIGARFETTFYVYRTAKMVVVRWYAK